MAKKWKHQTFRLASNRDWGAKPGNKILIIDRGAVRFDYPADWVFVPGGTAAKLYDREPPNDNCLIEVSRFYLPPGVDWSGLPLREQLDAALDGDRSDETGRSPTVSGRRGRLEFVWMDRRFIDSQEQRPAHARTCAARHGDVETLITFTFWEDDAARLTPVWDELLRSLRLGEYMALPVERGGN